MPTVKTLIGNVKGPKGDTGETGATGAAGSAATVSAGSVSTVAYGQPANVTNVGTPSAAVFNFAIPEGRPGSVGEISGYPVNAITSQQGNFPTPIVGDTIATVVGKQAKATADAQAGIQAANTSIANVLGDFGTVEPAATASKAYAVGDYLVLNGQFYKVTAEIAQGNALVVGGNIEATNVGAEVYSLKNDLAYKRFVGVGSTNREMLRSLHQTIQGLTDEQFINSKIVVRNSSGVNLYLPHNKYFGFYYGIIANLSQLIVTMYKTSDTGMIINYVIKTSGITIQDLSDASASGLTFELIWRE